MSKKTKYVIGIDIGTTSVRSLVYDERGEVVGEAHSSLDPVIPQPGCYEIDPDQLWEKVLHSEIWNKRTKSINHNFARCIHLFDQLFSKYIWNIIFFHTFQYHLIFRYVLWWESVWGEQVSRHQISAVLESRVREPPSPPGQQWLGNTITTWSHGRIWELTSIVKSGTRAGQWEHSGDHEMMIQATTITEN